MNYQKQGQDFLTKHSIKMTTKFIEYGLFFVDDKESRDIFKVSFSRLIPGVRTRTKDGGYTYNYKTTKFSIRFGQSLNDSTGNGDNKPTAYDVLACITKYEPGDFEQFCGDFGYDMDSRKGEKIYKAVCKEWQKVSSFFTEAEINELQEIQ
jgi:hypothetical protein